jgi:hypothetical protein
MRDPTIWQYPLGLVVVLVIGWLFGQVMAP